jgi:hypothetical protein
MAMTFEGLAAEIRSLNLPVDGDALAEALALYDELTARLTEALGRFDGTELWELDGGHVADRLAGRAGPPAAAPGGRVGAPGGQAHRPAGHPAGVYGAVISPPVADPPRVATARRTG